MSEKDSGSANESAPETTYRFLIDKEGNWYQDGIRVRHRLTYLYNQKLLDRDEEGRYFVDEGTGRLYVEVEDTPFVVRMADFRGGDFYVRLNDETEEKLDLENLRIDDRNVPYIKVKGGKFDARFSRPAYYELMKHAEETGLEYFIEERGVKHLIKSE
ncbi:MAG: DUF1285 domain-containing protein [Candidatus Dadabacteria bacterium]|nr:DUF1285 domain-containing protein [Candidatus Dadabacteria bacterium]